MLFLSGMHFLNTLYVGNSYEFILKLNNKNVYSPVAPEGRNNVVEVNSLLLVDFFAVVRRINITGRRLHVARLWLIYRLY